MLDIKQKPSIVISLNGWNEVDQALPVEAGRNAMAESLQRLDNRPTLIQRIKQSIVSNSQALIFLKRFLGSMIKEGFSNKAPQQRAQEHSRDTLYTLY